MNYNKYLIIFLIIFLVIISLSLLKYLFKVTPAKNIEIKKNFESNEEFSNKDTDNNIIKKEYNNLINNGNFENNKNPDNYITQSGYNKIIILKNPGLSAFVLEQRVSNEITYYELLCDNERNSKYNLLFWLSIKKNDISELNFEKLIKIKIQNEDFSNYIPRLNYNIIKKMILTNNDENIWYLIKYTFISNNTTKDKMQVYLNYDINLQFDTYYFTGLSLYRVLIDAENFIYNSQLISYVDGYHYESNTPTFHDLSGRGNDLFWSNIPLVDYTKGSMNIYNYKLTGFPANQLSNENFTVLLCINKNFRTDDSNLDFTSEEDDYDQYLFSIPGNERYSFEIKLKDNYIYIINGNKSQKSTNEVILYNKSIIAVTYKNKILSIYQDGYLIVSSDIGKIYFSSDNILINRNKNLNYNIYSLLFYNRVIEKDEMDNIREYFITNQNKNFNTPDINNYQMDVQNNTTLSSSSFLVSNFNDEYDNIFIDRFDNQNNKMKKDNCNCTKECKDLCSAFKDNIEKYNQCIFNCQNVLPSCQNFCEKSENSDSIYCNSANYSVNDCPKVYKKNGNYIVYIPPNSEYAKILNYSGEKSYGKNLAKARYTYNLNFPNCPTPSELIQGNSKDYIKTCPYVINEVNPCYLSVCGGVNWDVKNYKDLNLGKNCKKAVSNYCQINYNIDDNCLCWNPKNKENPECIQFRRHFEDPNDYCSASQFNIEEHPDFNKYIKKDNIPCWGCNLNEN